MKQNKRVGLEINVRMADLNMAYAQVSFHQHVIHTYLVQHACCLWVQDLGCGTMVWAALAGIDCPTARNIIAIIAACSPYDSCRAAMYT